MKPGAVDQKPPREIPLCRLDDDSIAGFLNPRDLRAQADFLTAFADDARQQHLDL